MKLCRLALPVIAVLTVCSASNAQTPDVVTKIYQCKSITDSKARLACYDDSVGRLEAAEKAGDIVTIDKEAAESIERDSFGFKMPNLTKLGLFKGDGDKPKKAKFETVVLPIKSMRIRGNRKFARFTLENGQVWDQTYETRKLKLADGENVLVIRKAALGSFLARINDTGPQIRVRRVE